MSAPEPQATLQSPSARPNRPPWILALLAVVALGALSWAGLRVYHFCQAVRSEYQWRRWLDAPESKASSSESPSPEVLTLKQQCLEMAGRLLDRFPQNAEALEVVGLLHFRFGHTEQAVKCWQHCVELNPRLATAYRYMGSVARDTGELDKAVECFRLAFEADPQMPGILVDLTDVLLKRGDLDQAETAARKSLQKDPRFLPSLYHLGEIHLRRREYQQARQVLEAAIEAGPEFANAYFSLATACSKLGDADKAREYMAEFKRLKAKEEQAHREWLKTLDGVSDVRRSLADVYMAAGRVYLGHGQIDQAESHFLEACRLAPDRADCGQTLAWLYQHQGRSDEALKILTDLSAKAPKDLGVYVSLGELCSELERFDQAEQAFRKALALVGNRAQPYASLAELYLRANREPAQARALATKAVSLEPAAPYYCLLAVACQRCGDLPGAREAIAQACRLAPDDPQYRRLREWLEQESRK